MRACKNTAFCSGFRTLALRNDEAARFYGRGDPCYFLTGVAAVAAVPLVCFFILMMKNDYFGV